MLSPQRSLLRRMADATLLYPVVIGLFLYGEWLLAGAVLGHPPVPSWDDPKLIDGSSWMHPLTGLVLFGALPMLSASLVLGVVAGMLPRISPRRLAGRLALFLTSWLTLFLLLRWDPGRVVEWWLD